MRIDEIDFFILKQIYQKEHTTTWEIAKAYFKEINPTTKEGFRQLNIKQIIVNQKLTRMSKMGLINIEKEKNGNKNRNIYNLIPDNILIKKHKFPNDCYSNGMYLKINNKWCLFEI